jgi:anti-sigma-K factor RskA
MQYQLWAIVDGKPFDAGLLIETKTADNKYNIQKMKSFGKAEAFAITLEKKGGSATPSMDKMYVISKTT